MAPFALADHPTRVLTEEQAQVLELLHRPFPEGGYAAVERVFGWSRGRAYNLAVKLSARKTESRIQERAQERRQRQREYLEQILNTTAKADVLDFLDGIPNDTVQLACFSPPYNLGKSYGDGGSADTMRATFYHGWLIQVLSEVSRILKPGGVVFLQVGSTVDWQDRLMPLDVLLYEDLRRSGLTFQSRIVWTVPHGLTPKTRLADRYETVLVFSKGEPVFNPNAIRIPQKNPGKRAFKGPNKGKLSGSPLGAWPTNVWSDIGSVRHNQPGKKHGNHPAPFPLKLAKRAILAYSMPGDLICDPFSGSGTTHEAAIQAGRAFVGADLYYEDLRARRIAEAVPDLSTPLTGLTDESIAVWQAEARTVQVAARPISDAEDRQMLFGIFA